MTHQDCQDRLLEFAYGELGRRDARKVEAHLAACPVCAGVYRRIAGVREVMGLLEPESPPGRGEQVVLAAARGAAERRQPGRSGLRLPRWAWSASAATVLVAAVAGLSLKLLSLREPGVREALAPAKEVQRQELAAAERAPAGAQPGSPAVKPAAPAPAGRTATAEAEAKGGRVAPAARPQPGGAGAAPRPARRPERAAAKVEAIGVRSREQEARAASADVERAPGEAGEPSSAMAARRAAPAAGEASGPAVAMAPAPAQEAGERRERVAGGPAAAPASEPPPAERRPALGTSAGPRDARVRAIRALVREVERQRGEGRLAEAARPFQACGPAEDPGRRLYATPDGRVVKYVRQTGSSEMALTYEQYYDAAGSLRHVFIHGGAVNGALLEHRIWLEPDGTRLREEQRLRRGRYPFPQTWPEAELSLRAPDASVLSCGAP